MVRAARDRKARHREATFRLDDAGAEVGVGEAALSGVSKKHPDEALVASRHLEVPR